MDNRPLPVRHGDRHLEAMMADVTSTSDFVQPDIVQCPHCRGWFRGWYLTDGPHPIAHNCPEAGVRIHYEYRVYPIEERNDD